jgi:hypothetical protein
VKERRYSLYELETKAFIKPLCHLRHQLPNPQPCLVESKLGLVFAQAHQEANSLVPVSFDIVEKKYQPLRGWQLHHGAFQVNTFHVAAQAAVFGARGVVQGQRSQWRQLANLREEGRIDLLGPGKSHAGEGAQKSIRRQLIGGKFMIGDPKCQRINSVAVLLVDLAVVYFPPFKCRE